MPPCTSIRYTDTHTPSYSKRYTCVCVLSVTLYIVLWLYTLTIVHTTCLTTLLFIDAMYVYCTYCTSYKLSTYGQTHTHTRSQVSLVWASRRWSIHSSWRTFTKIARTLTLSLGCLKPLRWGPYDHTHNHDHTHHSHMYLLYYRKAFNREKLSVFLSFASRPQDFQTDRYS